MSARVEEFSDTLVNRLENTRTRRNHTREFINRHRTNQLSVRNPRPITQLHRLILHINLDNLGIHQKLVLGQSLCDSLPDPSRATMRRESERRIGTPIPSGFIQDDILGHCFKVGRSDAFTEPLALHSCRRYSPYFEIVRTHKQVCNSLAYTDQPSVRGRVKKGLPIIRIIHSSNVLGF